MASRRLVSGRRLTSTLMAGALVVGGGNALADAAEQRLYQEGVGSDVETVAAEDLSADALHRFIDAAHGVQAVRREYARLVAEAPQEGGPALQVEAAAKMAQAVADQGFTVSEYREIGDLLETDETLATRLDRRADGGRG